MWYLCNTRVVVKTSTPQGKPLLGKILRNRYPGTGTRSPYLDEDRNGNIQSPFPPAPHPGEVHGQPRRRQLHGATESSKAVSPLAPWLQGRLKCSPTQATLAPPLFTLCVSVPPHTQHTPHNKQHELTPDSSRRQRKGRAMTDSELTREEVGLWDDHTHHMDPMFV